MNNWRIVSTEESATDRTASQEGKVQGRTATTKEETQERVDYKSSEK